MGGDVTPFYEHLYPGLLVYASRRLGEDLAYLAEDCVQDAVMSSYAQRARFANSMAWYAYIMKCVYHNSVAVLRKSRSHSNYIESGLIDASTSELDADMLEQEMLDRLYAAVETLPQKYRELLRMSYIDGMKIADIAVRMGVAEITVKKWKADALAQLRAMMDDASGLGDPSIGDGHDYLSILLVLVMLKEGYGMLYSA